MRRKPGIAGLEKQKLSQHSFTKVASELEEARVKQMTEQLEVFKTKLTEFALQHRKEINKDGEFRRQFQQMCSAIGVDPLASRKGFWNSLLGVGDFYYELAVQVAEVCMVSRRQAEGGFLDIRVLKARLEVMRSFNPHAVEITLDDIERAIKKLSELGNGFSVFVVGDVRVVQSVPLELNSDHVAVLGLTREVGGYVTHSLISNSLGWSSHRVSSVLDLLLQGNSAALYLEC